MEEWRSIAGHEGRYEVSSLGRVRSLPRVVKRGTGSAPHLGGIMTRTPNRNSGYHEVTLSNGKWKSYRVSRLVCEAFHGPSEGRHAAHRNGNNQDDRAENLAWLTAKENVADKYLHGTMRFGTALHNATLNEAQVLEIRRLRQSGMVYREIAEAVGVKYDSVKGVCGRGHYADVREAA